MAKSWKKIVKTPSTENPDQGIPPNGDVDDKAEALASLSQLLKQDADYSKLMAERQQLEQNFAKISGQAGSDAPDPRFVSPPDPISTKKKQDALWAKKREAQRLKRDKPKPEQAEKPRFSSPKPEAPKAKEKPKPEAKSTFKTRTNKPTESKKAIPPKPSSNTLDSSPEKGKVKLREQLKLPKLDTKVALKTPSKPNPKKKVVAADKPAVELKGLGKLSFTERPLVKRAAKVVEKVNKHAPKLKNSLLTDDVKTKLDKVEKLKDKAEKLGSKFKKGFDDLSTRAEKLKAKAKEGLSLAKKFKDKSAQLFDQSLNFDKMLGGLPGGDDMGGMDVGELKAEIKEELSSATKGATEQVEKAASKVDSFQKKLEALTTKKLEERKQKRQEQKRQERKEAQAWEEKRDRKKNKY